MTNILVDMSRNLIVAAASHRQLAQDDEANERSHEHNAKRCVEIVFDIVSGRVDEPIVDSYAQLIANPDDAISVHEIETDMTQKMDFSSPLGQPIHEEYFRQIFGRHFGSLDD